MLVVLWVGGRALLSPLAAAVVCREGAAASDVILVDLVQTQPHLLAKARELEARGLASVVLVPVVKWGGDAEAKTVATGFVDVMCRAAHVATCSTFDVALDEPFSLNLARRAAEELQRRGARSVLLVTDGFRSRRAELVYSRVLSPLGIAVRCQPAFGVRDAGNWSETAHGWQDVVLQWAKLVYYKVAVLARGA